MTRMRSSDDKCFKNFIDVENFKLSFQIQIYQLQIPLRNRIVDIREKLNNVNSSIDIYQKIADSKLRSCKSPNGNCLDETNQWLESTINSLSCEIYQNCYNHSIRKRSTCSQIEFKCNNDQCIANYFFCDGVCDCQGTDGCNDEPADCVRNCFEFRCHQNYRCIPLNKKCNGIDDCGDGSDECDCSFPRPTTSTTSTIATTTTTTTNPSPSYTQLNCLTETGDFLCDNNKCISLEQVCDGYNDCGDGSDENGCPLPPIPVTPTNTYTLNCSIHLGDFLCGSNKCIGQEQVCNGHNDCGDWSDEGTQCNDQQCSPECAKKGGVCFTEPKGSKCLYECPPGTYETSKGCSRFPEAPLPTLLQVLEDTPRLISRYSARLKYLKTKTIMALSKALREVVKCKKGEFSLLSKTIDYSTVIHEKLSSSRVAIEADRDIPGGSDNVIARIMNSQRLRR